MGLSQELARSEMQTEEVILVVWRLETPPGVLQRGRGWLLAVLFPERPGQGTSAAGAEAGPAGAPQLPAVMSHSMSYMNSLTNSFLKWRNICKGSLLS